MGCTSSQPTPTRGIVPAPRQVFPTRTSETAKSITRLDRYADRRAVEQVLETKFGPQIISEHGRDVLLWRVESRGDIIQIRAPRLLTDEEIGEIHEYATRSRALRKETLSGWGDDVQCA